jgi:hypothetical protein
MGGLIFWVDKGDFDRDGDIDLVVLRKDLQTIDVLLNDGNAQFTMGQSLPIGPDSLQVLAADADDDGIVDLLVARPQSPEILVFDGAGNGTFAVTQSITLPGGGQSHTMAIGDVTHDNVKDLVVSDPTLDRVLVYMGIAVTADFDPVPSILSVPGAPAACSVGDLTGDGLADIAVSAYLAGQFVIITDFHPMPGETSFGSLTVPVEGRASLTTIGDVTGDGLHDLVACFFDAASIVVAPQRAAGGFEPTFQLDATGQPLRPVIADVDHNGRNDLLVLSGLANRINLWLSQADGALVGARNWDSGLVESGLIAAADFDRDGVTEIVVGDPLETRLSVLRPAADRSLSVVSTIELGVSVLYVRVVDLDVDGRPDLVVPVSSGVKLVRNESVPGAPQFTVLPSLGSAFGSGVGPYGATAVDLDRDGRMDLAVADYGTGDLMILLGGADPFDFSRAPLHLPLGGNPVDVAAGDFTGDGILDLAVSRSGMSDIVLLRNDGKAELETWMSLPVGEAPNFLLTSDFNRDGRTDVAVANGDENTVSVLFGESQGFTRSDYEAGPFPSALLVDDITGDGASDILVASRTGEEFRVLVNDGAGGFANVFPFPGTLGASSVALADLDLDGDSDLVIGSVVSGRVSVVNNVQAQKK